MGQSQVGEIGAFANLRSILLTFGALPKTLLIGILFLILLTSVWRFVDLERDPPIVSVHSPDGWFDPAHYLYNARSHILFNEWRGEEGSALYVTRRLGRSPEAPPLQLIRSLAYFVPIVEELLEQPLPAGYGAYLKKKVRLLRERYPARKTR